MIVYRTAEIYLNRTDLPAPKTGAIAASEEVAARFSLDFDHGLTPRSKGQLAWYIGSDDCDEAEIPQIIPGALDIKEGDAETLRTFTFDGDSACFMSSALYSSLGLGSLEMTYVGDARCPCE